MNDPLDDETSTAGEERQACWRGPLAFFILFAPGVVTGVLWFLVYSNERELDSSAEFPIVTHHPSPGGTQPDRRRRDDLGWGRFNNSITEPSTPSREQVQEKIRYLERTATCSVEIFNSAKLVNSGVKRLQVVNNMVIGRTLWTFFLSPGWKQDGGPYALIVSGNPGTTPNNGRVYGTGKDVVSLPEDVALAGMTGYPVVGAVVNCGGRESQGNHPEVLKSIGEGIRFAREQFNADSKRVIFVGKSRGGAAALMWGANPLGLEYKTIAIFAHSPPTDFGLFTEIPVGTFPLFGALTSEIFSPDESKEWQFDDQFQERLQTGFKCYSGSTSQSEMTSRSPIAHVDKLKGIYLALGFGTHDPLVNVDQAFSFVHALETGGIEHFVEFTLGGGHWNSRGVRSAYENYTRKLLTGAEIELPKGRHWNRYRQSPTRKKEVYDPVKEQPVWAIFPVVTTPQRPNSVYVGAPVGSRVRIVASAKSSGQSWIATEKEIEKDYIRINLSVPPSSARYIWQIEIDGKQIPVSAIISYDAQGRKILPETLVIASERSLPEAIIPGEDRAFGLAWVMEVPVKR